MADYTLPDTESYATHCSVIEYGEAIGETMGISLHGAEFSARRDSTNGMWAKGASVSSRETYPASRWLIRLLTCD